MRLDGKVAVITGGARGIGLAIAKRCVREGAAVAIADISREGAEAAAAGLKQQGGRAGPITVNVADPASVSAMVASVLDAFGHIDILINNAGVGGNTPFLEIGLEEWNRIISINLTGAFLLGSRGRRNTLTEGVAMRAGKRRSDRALR